MRIFSTFLIFSVFCLSCETTETITLPTQADQFIRLQIGEQTVTLNALPTLGGDYYYANREGLSFKRSSADNLHVLRLALDGCTPTRGTSKQTFGEKSQTGDCTEVSIDYTTFELNNDPYCPHLEGVPTQLSGTIVVDTWGDDGMMVGSFESSDHGAYALSGDFRILVEE